MDLATFRKRFFELVEQSSRIVITAHISPDDDSIASVLALYTELTARFPNKDIRILYTGQSVDRYAIFHHFDRIEWVDDVGNHLTGVDTLIQLDSSQYARATRMPESFAQVPVKLCIDHHASSVDDFTCALVVPESSSNAELVYRVCEPVLTTQTAELYLLGILGDTGNLTHVDPSQSDVFGIVQTLVQKGNIRIDTFLSRYRTIPKHLMRLLGIYANNTTFKDVPGWPSVQYTFVERAIVQEYGFSDEDISAASHIYLGQYLPRIEGQTWGFVLSPRSDDGVRMSLRSLPGSVNVRVFAEGLGVGSGHDRASGANFPDSEPAQCLEKIFAWMEQNKPLIG